MTASADDPRVTRFREILAAADEWLAHPTKATPETAGALVEQITGLLIDSGLAVPFDYRVQDEMRGGFDNPPPPPEDLGACEEAVLRGKARFLADMGPVAIPAQVLPALIRDAWFSAAGEQPLIGREIPRASHKQDNPALMKAIIGYTIRWAVYHAAKDGTPDGWLAAYQNYFPGVFARSTLEEYKAYVPRAEREKIRVAARARRDGAQLTPELKDAEAEALRYPLEKLQRGLRAPRANEWK